MRDRAVRWPEKAGRRRSWRRRGFGVVGELKPFARVGKRKEGLALYSASRPAQVGGEEPPRIETGNNRYGAADLRGLLNGRVTPYPVYRRLF